MMFPVFHVCGVFIVYTIRETLEDCARAPASQPVQDPNPNLT